MRPCKASRAGQSPPGCSGESSSGRISLLLSAVAAATDEEETCAVVDCNDTFDLSSAAKAGIDFNRLLWVRCGRHSSGPSKPSILYYTRGDSGSWLSIFTRCPTKSTRRIISSWWFRFRRAIEHTSTALLVLTPIAAVVSFLRLRSFGT